jgi:creatinine amidohydrolase/Fe(II)-dependent formamide hydrolase-like protein
MNISQLCTGVISAVALLVSQPALAYSPFIEDYTSPELEARIKEGATTAIIPTGGTEDNGAYISLGKHNAIVRFTAQRIAQGVGNTLIAPVIAYVPQGSISPPDGHMKKAGTLSLREDTFAALLEDTAASLKQHGFKLICLVGDSGGNQAVQERVAATLTKMWQKEGVRVLHVSDYYANNGQAEWLGMQNLQREGELGVHAGFEDTAEMLASAPSMVRKDMLQEADKSSATTHDAALATPAFGNQLLSLKINAAIKQIRDYAASTPKPEF